MTTRRCRRRGRPRCACRRASDDRRAGARTASRRAWGASGGSGTEMMRGPAPGLGGSTCGTIFGPVSFSLPLAPAWPWRRRPAGLGGGVGGRGGLGRGRLGRGGGRLAIGGRAPARRRRRCRGARRLAAGPRRGRLLAASAAAGLGRGRGGGRRRRRRRGRPRVAGRRRLRRRPGPRAPRPRAPARAAGPCGLPGPLRPSAARVDRGSSSGTARTGRGARLRPHGRLPRARAGARGPPRPAGWPRPAGAGATGARAGRGRPAGARAVHGPRRAHRRAAAGRGRAAGRRPARGAAASAGWVDGGSAVAGGRGHADRRALGLLHGGGGAFTSRPAAWSFSRTSLVDRPCSLAISMYALLLPLQSIDSTKSSGSRTRPPEGAARARRWAARSGTLGAAHVGAAPGQRRRRVGDDPAVAATEAQQLGLGRTAPQPTQRRCGLELTTPAPRPGSSLRRVDAPPSALGRSSASAPSASSGLVGGRLGGSSAARALVELAVLGARRLGDDQRPPRSPSSSSAARRRCRRRRPTSCRIATGRRSPRRSAARGSRPRRSVKRDSAWCWRQAAVARARQRARSGSGGRWPRIAAQRPPSSLARSS